MRAKGALLVAVLLTSLFVGCLGGDDELEGTSDERAPDDEPSPQDEEPSEEEPEPAPTEVPDAPEPVVPEDEDEPFDAGPMVVLAHIDTGINPYHRTFRDTSALAQVHPSRYIPGYPADTPALRLTLDADSWEAAFAADAETWASLERGQLYWVPGTRIVGAVSLGDGGTFGEREETMVLDDHGHGTMTASRAASATHSLAPNARIVTVEGLGAESVRWAADQGWIDVQTNSWGSLLPHPVSGPADDGGIAEAFAYAAERMVTVEASGNGLGGFFGVAPCSTYTWAQGPPGVILVGAHDNGYVTAWSCSPPHVVADGFRPWAALKDSLERTETTGFACCTSTSAPYAAGAAARLVLQARTALGDPTIGVENGTLAQGEENVVRSGPLADGRFTIDELRTLLLATAEPRPVATEDDGDAHWFSEPGDVPRDASNPGENPYCEGCWTTFIPYSEVPPDVPAYFYVGYGAINIFSAENARSVLFGLADMPARAQEDEFYAADQALRGALFP